MSYDLPPLFDPDEYLRRLLLDRFTEIPDDGRHAGTAIPGNLESGGRTPFLMIHTINHGGRRLSGQPVVDVEVLGSYAQAKRLSREIDDFLMGYPHVVRIDGRTVRLDMVVALTSSQELEWESTNNAIRRFSSTYQFSVRR